MRTLLTTLPLAMLFLLAAALPLSHAAFTVLNINTTVTLNTNTSAQVIDIIKVSISNTSIQQYNTDRVALNLSISQWQNIIGPALIEHIVNLKGTIYDFNFLPGPIVYTSGIPTAFLVLSYYVSNVTTSNQTGPRLYVYMLNNSVFNFQHAESGPVLGPNTTLTVILPQGSRISSVYPIPDVPAYGFEQKYSNVTEISWNADEPLAQFVLTYTVQQSLQSEVITFFDQLYGRLGSFSYVIIIVAIALFIIYTYLKAGK